MSDSDSAVASFVFSVRNYFKTTHKTEVMERGGEAEAPQDSRFRFCKYCSKGFESSKALYGHLRIHSQYRDRSKGIETQRKPSPEEDEDEDEDCGFGCLVCKESFSTMQLLCWHMRIHRETVSGGVGQPTATTMSRESKSLSNPKSTVKEETESTVHLLVKDMPGWSQTGKRGLKRTASDDDIILNAVPLRFYYGPADPPPMKTTKKKKTEKSMDYEDTSIMEGAADSESPVGLSCKSMAKDRFGTHDCNKSKSRPCQGRRSTKKAKETKSVHQCEICGKTFATGQALGGHKTYHRPKDSFEVKLMQAKIKQESCVTTTMLSEEAHLSHQTHSKKMLDFDLNIPYEE
ncbi:hypothetical protein V6N12_072343 [Hibiscus sabdariffa]|uniref:C2H2-type domain-containing protein n=1 Tax=Hibiscus sabdariffa TaxID=183260 RepID=A0ABR2FME8_9ROSI